MRVSIKNLAVNMDLGNNGVTFDVYDNNDRHLGDLRIGRATIEWCQGRTREGNGIRLNWPQLIAAFEAQNAAAAAKKVAKKAAKKAARKTTTE